MTEAQLREVWRLLCERRKLALEYKAWLVRDARAQRLGRAGVEVVDRRRVK